MMESPWRSFVPHHVLLDLYRHPRRSPIGREQRMAVVALFADVSGFTAVSEALARTGKHSAEELTAILNRYFEPMIALVESYGGIIGKFGGDAMTILFPFAPAAQAATVRRAIQCAASMQGRMDDY
ncbi:MAG TPA: adenylate/guanylate cyclase domain-containing protein, partial [Herpetosiphonaceae bacterium]|nr:adenylate/guanylate cyclase domain-containing protein [Herpetosiphonaceae bacterium]